MSEYNANVNRKRSREDHTDCPLVYIAEPDTFDITSPIDANSVCSFCQGGRWDGEQLKLKLSWGEVDDREKIVFEDNGIDPECIWASKYSLNIGGHKQKFFFHFYCAFLSPQAYIFDGKWFNLASERRRSRSFTCKFCNLSGATLGCFERKCSYVLHIPCAVHLGWKPKFVKFSEPFYCSAHDTSYERACSEFDISVGKENFEVTVAVSNKKFGIQYSSSLKLPMFKSCFKYISSNVDSDYCRGNLLFVEECCSCFPSCEPSSCPCSAEV